MGENKGCGDAQDALKKLIGGKIQRADASDPNTTFKPNFRVVINPISPTSDIDITDLPTPPPLPSQTHDQSRSTNTPLTDRSTHSTDSTRYA
jgi:hypothetical protein